MITPQRAEDLEIVDPSLPFRKDLVKDQNYKGLDWYLSESRKLTMRFEPEVARILNYPEVWNIE